MGRRKRATFTVDYLDAWTRDLLIWVPFELKHLTFYSRQTTRVSWSPVTKTETSIITSQKRTETTP